MSPAPADSVPDPPADARATLPAELLGRARAGDRDALDAVLRPEMDLVYATCRRMVGSRADAEELAQEAMVRVIRGLGSFDGRSSLSTWVTRVTINTCLSWLRAKARRAGREPGRLEFPDRLTGNSPGEGGVQSVGEGPGEDPEQARVRLALEALSPDHRAVLVLRDVRDLDYEAIGAALDLPVGTVKSRIFRARAALRQAIEAVDEQGAGQQRPDERMKAGTEREPGNGNDHA